jgi:hypothetical protein
VATSKQTFDETGDDDELDAPETEKKIGTYMMSVDGAISPSTRFPSIWLKRKKGVVFGCCRCEVGSGLTWGPAEVPLA